MVNDSGDKLAIARANAEAYARGDYQEALSHVDPEVVYDITRNSPEGAIFHGHDGLREGLLLWLDTWDDYRVEIDEVIDAGADKVVIAARQGGRGRETGADVANDVAWIYTIRGGKIVRIETHPSKDAALAAAAVA
jgi:ketosteroid isomerase-like protein